MTRDEFIKARIEHYRTMGQDYGNAAEWAVQDANTKYGK